MTEHNKAVAAEAVDDITLTADSDERTAGNIVPVEPDNSDTPATQEFLLRGRMQNEDGLLKHRLVILSCIMMALAIIGLSSIDTTRLISYSATLDRSFKVTETKLPHLPANLAFEYVNNRPTERLDPNFITQQEGLYAVQEAASSGMRFGYVDGSGRVVIKPQFQYASKFLEGTAVAGVSPDTKSMWQSIRYGLIDKTGKWLIQPTFPQLGPCENGRSSFVKKDGMAGLIDRTGRVVFQEKLDSMPEHIGKAYKVQYRYGKIGLIDRDGHWLCKPEYDWISELGSDTALNVTDEIMAGMLRPFAIDKTASSQYFLVTRDSVCGVIDDSGKWIVPIKFQRIQSFRNGHVAFTKEDMNGFADAQGNVVIKPQFDEVTAWDKIIAVKQHNKWFFIDNRGHKLAKPPVNDVVKTCSGDWLFDGMGAVRVGSKYGYVDASGEMAIPPKFAFASPFNKGVALVWDGQYWRYIDKTGKYATPIKFGSASLFTQGQAIATVPGILFQFAEADSIKRINRSLSDWITANDKPHETSQ